MQPVIITAALVGAEVTREQQPALPITPQEIIEAAIECYHAGAAMVHLHVRDSEGRPTQDGDLFREVVTGIRERCDIITQVSTGGAIGMSAEERLQGIECRPDMATLTTGSVNFGQGIFVNDRPLVEKFARRLHEYHIVPELSISDIAMIDEAIRLLHLGLVSAPLNFDFTMGAPGGIAADAFHLTHMVRCLPPGSNWSVGAVGPYQLTLGTVALAMGGNVRVGFEDNIYYNYRKAQLAKSNAELVARMVRIAHELSRQVATPVQARKILQIDRYRSL